jgi:hypothetical protein
VEHSTVLIGHYYPSATLKTAVARSSATYVIKHQQHLAINTGVQTSNHRKQLDVDKPFVKANQSHPEAIIQ